jgi:hypothetical protein
MPRGNGVIRGPRSRQCRPARLVASTSTSTSSSSQAGRPIRKTDHRTPRSAHSPALSDGGGPERAIIIDWIVRAGLRGTQPHRHDPPIYIRIM